MKILAHRGDHSAAPENSLAAFRNAVSAGADGVELDVAMTADGEIAVFHDDHMSRMTDYGGADRFTRHISDFLWEDLRELRLIHRAQPSRERIPLLAEVLDVLPDQTINVEIKTDPQQRNARIAAAVLAVVNRRQTIFISSFDKPLLAEYRRQSADARISVLLAGPTAPWDMRGEKDLRQHVKEIAALDIRPEAIAMTFPSYMGTTHAEIIREAGYQPIAWTCSEPNPENLPEAQKQRVKAEIQRNGFTAFLTDWPKELRQLLSS